MRGSALARRLRAEIASAKQIFMESSGRDPVLAGAAAELDRYFAGGLRAFRTALDWSLVSGFTERVLQELAASVPYGTVVGYQRTAGRLDRGCRAARRDEGIAHADHL